MNQRPDGSRDLDPPPFAEGLCDWSQSDGAADSPSYEESAAARIARGDADFGDCLELRKTEAIQRLRYMGEMPLRRDAALEVRVRLKALRGPLPAARVAAAAGGAGGLVIAELEGAGPSSLLPAHEETVEIAAVIATAPGPGVDVGMDARALYAHVGLDLIGPLGAVVRIEDIRVRERRLGGREPKPLPGFRPSEVAGA
jgi:hypothetical protein